MNITKLLFISHYFVINLTVLAFEMLIFFYYWYLGRYSFGQKKGSLMLTELSNLGSFNNQWREVGTSSVWLISVLSLKKVLFTFFIVERYIVGRLSQMMDLYCRYLVSGSRKLISYLYWSFTFQKLVIFDNFLPTYLLKLIFQTKSIL